MNNQNTLVGYSEYLDALEGVTEADVNAMAEEAGEVAPKPAKKARLSKAEQVKAAMADFYRVASEYADFGASDTEPRSVFAGCVCDAFEQGVDRVERSGAFWQLYSSVPGYGKAARALYSATKRVVKLILSSKRKDQDAVEAAIEYYFFI